MSKKGGAKYQEPETDSDEEIMSDEEVEFDLIEEMQAMTVGERKNVYALKGITKEYRDLRRQYFDELAALELKALAIDQAIAEERRKIIAGEREPTEEEIAKGTDTAESGVEEIPSDDEDEKPKRKGVKVVTPAEKKDADAAEQEGGIPRFWLNTFKNSEVLDSMLTERDEEALAHLKDVRMSYVDEKFYKGFKIDMHFAENEFFDNKILSKTFIMEEDDDDEDGGTLDTTVGTDIEWKSPEKNMTITIKQKKQRHKSGKGIRIVNKEEKVPSFFNFFRTPEEPESDCDEEEEEMYQEQMEMDFEAGMALRSGIVQRPAFYFSGKSVEAVAAQLREQFGFGMEDDDEEDEDDEEEDEESEDDRPAFKGRGRGGASGGRGGAQKPGGKQDCKQQ